jgi:hypothetical protein
MPSNWGIQSLCGYGVENWRRLQVGAGVHFYTRVNTAQLSRAGHRNDCRILRAVQIPAEESASQETLHP